ncbi:MAG TPA: hypothetical protein VFW33_07305 [Gemmataceae bacterium]|nr:hypothetical protein [Gemmataceae bacterium]
MPGTFARRIPPLLAALVLLAPGKVVAGPPKGASGKMVFDEVADGLRRYANEKNGRRRAELLRRLAPTHDPRVALALGKGLGDPSFPVHAAACDCLVDYYAPRDLLESLGSRWMTACQWWNANEADPRRRAAQLPR